MHHNLISVLFEAVFVYVCVHVGIACLIVIIHSSLLYRAVYVVIPIYVAEISPKERRGCLMSSLGFFYSFGILFGFSVTAALSDYKEGWRLTNAILGLSSLIYTIGSALIPHSPWLVLCDGSKNKC